MTRRLLALLAILSGLAALHAPAHASRLDDLSYDIETLVEIANSNKGAACQCELPPKGRKILCEEQARPLARPRLPGVMPPSVIVGADFSLE